MKGHSLRRVSFVLGFIPIKLKKALLCILLDPRSATQGAMAGDTLARLLKHEAHAPRASGELLLQELSCLARSSSQCALENPLVAKARSHTRRARTASDASIYSPTSAGTRSGWGMGTMPDVLHAYETDEKEAIVDALTHYLISAQTPLDSEPVAADASTILRGRNLYHAVGCVACHGAHSHQKTSWIRHSSARLTFLRSMQRRRICVISSMDSKPRWMPLHAICAIPRPSFRMRTCLP